MQKCSAVIKKYFVSGLIILLPAAITIWILALTVRFLTRPFTSAVVEFLSKFQIDLSFALFSHEEIIFYGSQLLVLLGLVFFIVFLGFIGRSFFLNILFKFSDFLMKKIPLVNKFYKTSQEIIRTLFVTNKNSFKQVVMLPFPDSETYCIGLVAKESPRSCSDDFKDGLVSVLVPTTPNPTTGFILLMPKKDLVFLNMKREEAIKYVVSCGVVAPKTYTGRLEKSTEQ